MAKKIEPINIWVNGETQVGEFLTDAVTTNTYWTLNTSDSTQCAQGNYQMTEEQFATWGVDNTVVDGYVAEAIGVVIVPPIV